VTAYDAVNCSQSIVDRGTRAAGIPLATSMHGYEIYQQLRAATGLGLVWRIKRSQLYALLAEIEARGYVAATTLPQEGGLLVTYST